ncbi:hypothetical protein ERJ75_001480600 [Trypanosoma vivax]|nr:hypothetical protein ERJ75_001480600 [Trypanosoma vivax]
MCRAHEEARTPRTHRSALLDRVRPAPKRTKLDRLCETLLAQFRSGTSKHFGLPHRVLARKTDRFECRWCGAQGLGAMRKRNAPWQSQRRTTRAHPTLGWRRESATRIFARCAMRFARVGRRCNAPSENSRPGDGL